MKAKQDFYSPEISTDKLNLACRDITRHAPDQVNEIHQLTNQLFYRSDQTVKFQEKDKLLLSAIRASLTSEQLKQCVHFRLLCDATLLTSTPPLPIETIAKDVMLTKVATYLDYDVISKLQSTCNFFYFNNNLAVYKYNQLPHTAPEVISKAIKALFDWVDNKLDKETFNGAIVSIITNPDGAYRLYREETVIKYLKISQESNANKLAFILSSGGASRDSLNTLLIKHLMQLIVFKVIPDFIVNDLKEKTLDTFSINLNKVKDAFERNEFDQQAYTLHAIQYAKENQRFTHLYSADSLARFNKWMYEWVAGPTHEIFS